MSNHLNSTKEIQNKLISEVDKYKREKQLAIERKVKNSAAIEHPDH